VVAAPGSVRRSERGPRGGMLVPQRRAKHGTMRVRVGLGRGGGEFPRVRG
jgi:hypothetical protein